MERRHSTDRARTGVVVHPPSPRSHDAFLGAEDPLARGIAETDQNVRIYELNLSADEWQADLRLLRRGRAVARRPPRNDIGDVDVCVVEADRSQHQVEQFSGSADEGLACEILVAAGRLTDQHDPGLRIAAREYELRRRRLQGAAIELVQQIAQLF